MYGVKNEGLEKEKPVRVASRMLGAKLIELYFRLNDRGVPISPGRCDFRPTSATPARLPSCCISHITF